MLYAQLRDIPSASRVERDAPIYTKPKKKNISQLACVVIGEYLRRSPDGHVPPRTHQASSQDASH